jgi:hypothetical protein
MIRNLNLDMILRKFPFKRISEAKTPILKKSKYFNVSENTNNGKGNR